MSSPLNISALLGSIFVVAAAVVAFEHAKDRPLAERKAMASRALQKRAEKERPSYGFRVHLWTFLGFDLLGFGNA